MCFSFSSLLMTLIAASVLILLLHLILTGKKHYRLFRTDFLGILMIAVLLRILFPVEFFFTISIYSEHVMTAIRDFLLSPVTANLDVQGLLLLLWGCGSVIAALRYASVLWRTSLYIRELKRSSICTSVKDLLPDYRGKNYSVCLSAFINTPMVLGFAQTIFLPDIAYSAEEQRNIIIHEIQHIIHKDIYIKQIVNLLTILYWWFPLIYVLRKQVDLYLEMRADSKVTSAMDPAEYKQYLHHLLDIRQKVKENIRKKSYKRLSSCFINDDKQMLDYRTHYLIEGFKTKKTRKLILAAVLCLPLFSNAIIFEPYYADTPNTESTYDLDDLSEGHIIHHKDGSYTLELDGQSIAILDPDSELFNVLKIIEE